MSVNHFKNIIEVRQLSYAYGSDDLVLENVNLDIHQGDYLGIIGPNGGGKTTLIKLILHLFKLQTGTIKLFGQPISEFNQWHRLGYVPQKTQQFDTKFPVTVKEVVQMGRFGQLGIFHQLSASDNKIVDQSLTEVDMLSFKDRLIGELSGGQQQRVFIAKALASRPDIIFLDEPTAGVDQKNQIQFYKLLKFLNHNLQLTLVLISHDIEVIIDYATEIACVNKTLIYDKDPKKLISHQKIIHQH